MKFTKYNNPNRRRRARKSQYSNSYVAEQRKELEMLLAKAKTDRDKEMLIKAYDVTIRP